MLKLLFLQFWYFVVSSLLFEAVYGDNSTCGALVTYHQYADIFKTAPSCLQNGCGSGNLTSMTSTCTPTSACYTIWNILHQEYQQDWCSTCHSEDSACRLPGWPILNATAACDVSPDGWIFKSKGCCTDGGNEMASLATWIQILCNGTWRGQFTNYSGMAQLDWEEYIMPDNYTVSSANVFESDCASGKDKLLGMICMENAVMVLAIIGYITLTVWYSREDTRHKRWTRRMSGMKPLKWVGSNHKKGSMIKTILLAIFFVFIQFLFNIASAYKIKNASGYGYVNAPLLALFFCTRPHLSWAACVVAIIPRTWIERHLTTQQANLFSRGMFTIRRVSIVAAISELIMQLLGGYYLGKAVHVGLERDFYKHNHLSPYWRGVQARNMYNGAMLWAIGIPLVVVIWIAGVLFQSHVSKTSGTIGKKHKWRKNGSSPETTFFIPQTPIILVSTPSLRQSSRIYEPPANPEHGASEPSSVSLLEDSDEATHAEMMRTPQYRAPQMATVPRFSMSSPPLQSHPVNQEDPFADPNAPSTLQTQEQEQDITSPADEEEVPPQLRPGHRDSISHPHFTDEFDTTSPTSPPLASLPFTSIPSTRNNQNPFSDPEPSQIRQRHPPSQTQLFSNNTEYQGVQLHDMDEVETHLNNGFEPERRTESWSFETWIPILGFMVGLVSYIAQWVFWVGYFGASGERFCPSNTGTLGGLWILGGLLGFGVVFVFSYGGEGPT